MRASLSDQLASKVIRSELLRRGMSRYDLAALTSYKVGTVANVISGNDRHRTVRGAIETALDMPIWSDPKEFHAHRVSAANPEHATTSTL